jgi:hypothetical protein
VTTAASAQHNTVNLHRLVEIKTPGISLDALLHQITAQTGARFSINTRKFPAQKVIAIHTGKQTIQNWLDQLHQHTGIYYATLGDHIILLDNPPHTPAKQPPHTTGNNNTSVKNIPVAPRPNNTPVAKRTSASNRTGAKNAAPRNEQPVTQQPTVPPHTSPTASTHPSPPLDTPVVKDTAANMPAAAIGNSTAKDTAGIDSAARTAFAPVPGSRTANQQRNAKTPTTRHTPSVAAGNKHNGQQGIFHDLFAKGGLAADDVFYANAMVQAGIPYVYGIVGYGSSFKLLGFRYGLGASLPLSNKWRLHLQVTTGRLASQFDSLSIHWQFKTQLHRAGVMAEVNAGNNLSIQFGPVLNIMKLRFYSNGNNTAPGLTRAMADEKFNLIQPIYTLSDNYSVTSANSTKLWVGLQISFLYRFNFFKHE